MDDKVPKIGKKPSRKKSVGKNKKKILKAGGTTCEQDFKKYFIKDEKDSLKDVQTIFKNLYTNLTEIENIYINVKENEILKDYLRTFKYILDEFLKLKGGETKCKDFFTNFLLDELQKPESKYSKDLENFIQATTTSINKFIIFEATKDGKLNMKWTTYGIGGLITGPFPDFVENFVKSIKAIDKVSNSGSRKVEITSEEPSFLKKVYSRINIAQLGNTCENIYKSKQLSITLLENQINSLSNTELNIDKKEIFNEMQEDFSNVCTKFLQYLKEKSIDEYKCHQPFKEFLLEKTRQNEFYKTVTLDKDVVKYKKIITSGENIIIDWDTPANVQNFWMVFIDDYLSSLKNLLLPNKTLKPNDVGLLSLLKKIRAVAQIFHPEIKDLGFLGGIITAQKKLSNIKQLINSPENIFNYVTAQNCSNVRFILSDLADTKANSIIPYLNESVNAVIPLLKSVIEIIDCSNVQKTLNTTLIPEQLTSAQHNQYFESISDNIIRNATYLNSRLNGFGVLYNYAQNRQNHTKIFQKYLLELIGFLREWDTNPDTNRFINSDKAAYSRLINEHAKIYANRTGGTSKPVVEKYKYKNKKYKIRVGPKGGKYILVDGETIRI